MRADDRDPNLERLAAALGGAPFELFDEHEFGARGSIDGSWFMQVSLELNPPGRHVLGRREGWVLRLGCERDGSVVAADQALVAWLVGHYGPARLCSDQTPTLYDDDRHGHLVRALTGVDSRSVDVQGLLACTDALAEAREAQPFSERLREAVGRRAEPMPTDLRGSVQAAAATIFATVGGEDHWARWPAGWAADAVTVACAPKTPERRQEVKVGLHRGQLLDGGGDVAAFITALHRWLTERWARAICLIVSDGQASVTAWTECCGREPIIVHRDPKPSRRPGARRRRG